MAKRLVMQASYNRVQLQFLFPLSLSKRILFAVNALATGFLNFDLFSDLVRTAVRLIKRNVLVVNGINLKFLSKKC